MFTYALSRLLQAIVTVAIVAVFSFFLLYLTGDPIGSLLPTWATEAQRAELATRMGLDKPLWIQFLRYAYDLLHGDLGESFRHHREVLPLLLNYMPATLLLAVSAIGLSVVVGLPLGVLAALNRGGWLDRVVLVAAALGQSVPPFWLGILSIMVFSVWLGWVPTSGYSGLESLVLPSLTLAAYFVVVTTRLVRSELQDILDRDYVRTAKAKGLAGGKVVFKHALRNAILPVFTVMSLQTGLLLGGAVVTEIVFAWPGIGRVLVEAIYARDFPVIRGGILIIGTGLVIINIVTDMLYVAIDPRVRLS